MDVSIFSLMIHRRPDSAILGGISPSFSECSRAVLRIECDVVGGGP